jgi:hypothetical protein
MALRLEGDIPSTIKRLAEQGVVMTGPAGYLRLAPHFYQNDEQMVRAADILNKVCRQRS